MSLVSNSQNSSLLPASAPQTIPMLPSIWPSTCLPVHPCLLFPSFCRPFYISLFLSSCFLNLSLHLSISPSPLRLAFSHLLALHISDSPPGPFSAFLQLPILLLLCSPFLPSLPFLAIPASLRAAPARPWLSPALSLPSLSLRATSSPFVQLHACPSLLGISPYSLLLHPSLPPCILPPPRPPSGSQARPLPRSPPPLKGLTLGKGPESPDGDVSLPERKDEVAGGGAGRGGRPGTGGGGGATQPPRARLTPGA